MAQPTARKGTLNNQFRMRVPANILDRARGKVLVVDLPATGSLKARTRTVAIGGEVKVSLGTANRDDAKARFAAASAQVLSYFASLRAGPVPLSHRQVIALSGEVYRLFTERFLDDPGSPAAWEALKAFNRAAMEGRIASAPPLRPDHGENGATTSLEPARETFGPDLTAGINALPVTDDTKALEERFGLLVSWVLARHQTVTDDASRLALLKAVADATQDAAWALKRAANGDYTPDRNAGRFPPITAVRKAVSMDDLFKKWQAETKPSASTLSTWNGVIRSFSAHLKTKADDVNRITPEDVIAWKDAIVARGLSAKTVSGSHLAAIRTVFNYGVANRLLASNPAEGVRIAGRQRAGEGRLAYADDEVAALLAFARREENPYKRWLPFLAAATGARIGELAQLWGSRVTTEAGFHVLKIAPAEDGGSLKNEGSERTVPLHPALVREGFLDFVKTKGTGPLFYRRTSGRPTARHASKGTINHLAEWVRGQDGFGDPRKAPAHALRHWWKSAAVRAGVADSVADAIQGHAATSVAGRYRHFALATLADAIAKMPLPVNLPRSQAASAPAPAHPADNNQAQSTF